MKLVLHFIYLGIAIAMVATGCTSRQVYYSGSGWRQNECNKLLDQSERERCLSEANTSYEDYKRQTGGSEQQ